MIFLVSIVVFILVALSATVIALNFFDRRNTSNTNIILGTYAFDILCVILSISLVTIIPAKLALKYCDYTPTYSHSKPIYDLRGEYVTELEDDYMIYVISSDTNNIYERYLPKENTNIIDVETETPHIDYYSPKFKNKLVDLYFNQAFTIDKYDIYI